MAALSRLLLALTLLLAGCAGETRYSGSQLDSGAAASRSSFIFVGKILTAKVSKVESNTFFLNIRSDVKVIQPIRGEVQKVVPVSYTLDGQDSVSRFHVGDVCIFYIFVKSLVVPGEYMVGKILPATPEILRLRKKKHPVISGTAA